MKSSTKNLFFIASWSLAISGCGSPTRDETVSQNPKVGVSPTTTEKNSKGTQSAPVAALEKSLSEAEVATQDFESPVSDTRNVKVESAKAQATPSTAIEAISLVNLRELPRLNEKNAVESRATHIYYTGKCTLTEADAFYKKLLESRGWKEIPPLTPPTEQYVDRLFEKMSYYLRATMYPGSERGELEIMLTNLGNVDVRSLPKLPDAEVGQTPSTPVNYSYHSASSIPDAAEALLKKFTASGWQCWNEFQKAPEDVPHYRDLHLRKEACQLHVGVAKNPQDPNGKSMVFYHAEPVTPFDIPMTDATRMLKLDLTSGRASFGASNSRSDLVSILRANSQRFGWELGQTDKFEAGEEHMVPIYVNSGAYVEARLVESGGEYFGAIESFASVPKKKVSDAELIASNDKMARNENPAPDKDTSLDEFNAQLDSKIQGEIAKALGSINGPASGPKELAMLEAMAKELTKSLGSTEPADSDDHVEKEQTQVNPFDVPEDTSAPSDEFRAINRSFAKLKHAGKSYDLKHVACYVMQEYGEPTKCVIFSDSPIDVEKLKRMLLEEGKAVYGNSVSEKATNVLSFRVTESYASIDANIGNLSMGIATTKVEPSLSYFQGKIAGKIVSTDPIDIGGSTIEFAAQLNQPVVLVDWTKRNSPEAKKLVADTSKEYLLPEGCDNFSSEGSKYSKKINATIKAPIASVQAFYSEQLGAKGWKETGNAPNGFKKYRTAEQEMEIQLKSVTNACEIEMLVRNSAAAKADSMLPPAGKAMLVLGNLSDSLVQMTIAGKTYQVSPSERQNPKDATKVVVEPGSVTVQVTGEKGTQKLDMKVDASADSTWGILFDTSFQDVLRLF